MRYYKVTGEGGRVYVVGIGLGGIEISEEEYDRLKSEMHAKSDLADELYWGKIAIEAVPEEWREEVREYVDARIAECGTAEEQDISDSEALAIILGGTDG